MKKIGFIGLGNMGKGMSINLSKNDYLINGFDLNEKVFIDLKDYQILSLNSVEEVAKNSEIVITMLPDGESVKKVWKDLIKFCKKNSILIDCSTIDVKTSIEVQNNAHKFNLKTLDAPVSGGVIGSDNGTLTFMVGGDQSIYKDVINLFEIMGNKAILCGSFGAGQTAKICNNLLLASTMIALGESLNLGKNLGLEMEKLLKSCPHQVDLVGR